MEGGTRDAVRERALRCPLQKIQRFLHIAVVLQLAGVRQAEGCAGRISLCCLGEVGNAGVSSIQITVVGLNAFSLSVLNAVGRALVK